MKYIKPKFVLIFVLLFAFLALPAFAETQNEPKGYGGFKWNAPAKNFLGQYKRNLIMYGDNGHFEIFKNKKEADIFDGVKGVRVKNVLYFFNKADGFALVNMDFNTTKADFKKLLEYGASEWGEPDKMEDIEKSGGWVKSGGAIWQCEKTFVKIHGSIYSNKGNSVSGEIIIGLKEYDIFIYM